MARQSNSKRVHVVIPDDDDVTMEWLDAQHNMSFSIRYLIREHVKVHGEYADVMSTGLPVVPKREKRNALKEYEKVKASESISKQSSPKPVKVEQPKPKKQVSASSSPGIELSMDDITSLDGEQSLNSTGDAQAQQDITSMMNAK